MSVFGLNFKHFGRYLWRFALISFALTPLSLAPGGAKAEPAAKLESGRQTSDALSPGAETSDGLAPGAAVRAGLPTASPQRVVSMNLCTDQLAMLLAAPGQLISVSVLARDPLSSAMAERAKDFAINHGLAEEIFLMRPDLVLSEPYTRPATVALLRQLGLRVELVEPAASLADIPRAVLDLGRLLGREEAALAEAEAFKASLAQYTPAGPLSPKAALYHANGYTTGAETLGGDILAAAGLRNIASDLGLAWGGTLPLEELLLAAPDVVITGQSYPGRSRAEDLLTHKALVDYAQKRPSATALDADWLCGTPFALKAVAAMAAVRKEAE